MKKYCILPILAFSCALALGQTGRNELESRPNDMSRGARPYDPYRPNTEATRPDTNVIPGNQVRSRGRLSDRGGVPESMESVVPSSTRGITNNPTGGAPPATTNRSGADPIDTRRTYNDVTSPISGPAGATTLGSRNEVGTLPPLGVQRVGPFPGVRGGAAPPAPVSGGLPARTGVVVTDPRPAAVVEAPRVGVSVARVSIIPGRAHQTQWTWDTTTAYLPTERQATIIEYAPPVPRPIPAAVPEVLTTIDRQRVTDVLSRERTENRYGGPVLVTDAIHFDYDSYAIKPESFASLDAIGDALLNPPLEASIINIEGHTDADGSDSYNQQLSQKRAWSVKSYLVDKFGIDPNRLVIVGYGENAPIAANDSPAGKSVNRRVEFENVTGLHNGEVTQTKTTTIEKSY